MAQTIRKPAASRRRLRKEFSLYVRMKAEYIRNLKRIQELENFNYLFLTEREELRILKQYPFREVLDWLIEFEKSPTYRDGDFFEKMEGMDLPIFSINMILEPLPKLPERYDAIGN